MTLVHSGSDAHSLNGDPMFVDAATGDFRVKDGSSALKTGFKNFPMDQFGVKKPALKAIAKTPVIPPLRTSAGPDANPAPDPPPTAPRKPPSSQTPSPNCLRRAATAPSSA